MYSSPRISMYFQCIHIFVNVTTRYRYSEFHFTMNYIFEYGQKVFESLQPICPITILEPKNTPKPHVQT